MRRDTALISLKLDVSFPTGGNFFKTIEQKKNRTNGTKVWEKVSQMKLLNKGTHATADVSKPFVLQNFSFLLLAVTNTDSFLIW